MAPSGLESLSQAPAPDASGPDQEHDIIFPSAKSYFKSNQGATTAEASHSVRPPEAEWERKPGAGTAAHMGSKV